MQLVNRAIHADALHQAGRQAEAMARFLEAERAQAQWQPNFPLLYSLQGFRYCDLLVGAAERTAWKAILKLENQNSELETAAASRRAVSQRAAQTLQWAEQDLSLLSIGLDRLTLARAALYAAILEKTEIRNVRSEIESSVHGLRRAGTQDQLPRALLTPSVAALSKGRHRWRTN